MTNSIDMTEAGSAAFAMRHIEREALIAANPDKVLDARPRLFAARVAQGRV